MSILKYKDPNTGEIKSLKMTNIEKTHIGSEEPTDLNKRVWFKPSSENGEVYDIKVRNENNEWCSTSSGNADTLGGKEPSEYALVSDVSKIQSTSGTRLIAKGWYRVAEYLGKWNVSGAKGSTSNSCKLTIKRVNSQENNEYHELQITSIQNKQEIKY